MNDMKMRIAFWDRADDQIISAIEAIAGRDDLRDLMYDSGVIPKVREAITEFLDWVGVEYPEYPESY